MASPVKQKHRFMEMSNMDDFSKNIPTDYWNDFCIKLPKLANSAVTLSQDTSKNAIQHNSNTYSISSHQFEAVMEMLLSLLKGSSLKATMEKPSSFQDAKNTVKNVAESVSLTGVSIAVGGLLGGPPGLFIGGVIGSGLCYLRTRNKFKPVHKILKGLSRDVQIELCCFIILELCSKSVNFSDIRQLINYVKGNKELKKKIEDLTASFFSTNLNAKVKRN